MSVIGPLDTRQKASDLPQVQEVYAAFRTGGASSMTPANLQMLLAALHDAGVTPGVFEAEICEWPAGWEPTTVAVICALVSRANQP